MATGISAYKNVAVETAPPQDLSKKVITSILSYIREAENAENMPHYKECLLNAQMLCVGALFSLSCSERTKMVVTLANVFDTVQYTLLQELKTPTKDLSKCKTLLTILIEVPTYIG